MFRFRRYRLFLLAIVLAAVTVYQITRVRNWEVPIVGEGVQALRKFGFKDVGPAPTSRPVAVFTSSTPLPITTTSPALLLDITSDLETVSPSTRTAALDVSQTLLITSSTQTRSSSHASASTHTQPLTSLKARPFENDVNRLAVGPPTIEEVGHHGQGRLEIPLHDAQVQKPMWIPQKEHFPVPTESFITLPTGVVKSIPRIQYKFGEEEPSAAARNQLRQATIAEAFKHAWSGYSQYAMLHDELSPVTGGVKDPFNGWGATLVDTLDTLWIMELREEFDAAVKEINKIDFKTSLRQDIPLFETVIRYLGGLISAYDLTSEQYPILLDKAIELAEILMGSFDTPNRMPVTYYHWAPLYATQPRRADTRVVLAELGSLSVEFTRLAQITKETKYYDAIARITNELEAMQSKTSLPGLWPTIIDASGCKRTAQLAMEMTYPDSAAPGSSMDEEEIVETSDVGGSSEVLNSTKEVGAKSSTHQVVRRQLDDVTFEPIGHSIPAEPKGAIEIGSPSTAGEQPPNANLSMAKLRADDSTETECDPQRLVVPSLSQTEVYGIGGQADSTYEYLSKEYMLLGGLNGQYRTMYEDAMDVVRRKLLFRPMTKDNRDILSVATYSIANYNRIIRKPPPPKVTMVYEGTHLTCFAGGMFAIGAKIFDLPSDLEIAKKLTNGCIWAYESTTTGIMPETFELVPCDNLADCAWNETKWWDALDPDRKQREEQAKLFNKNRKEALEKAARQQQPAQTQTPTPEALDTSGGRGGKVMPTEFGNRPAATLVETLPKRQVDDSAASDDKSDFHAMTFETPTKTSMGETMPEVENHTIFTPTAALSHEEFVKARIREERLPPGFTRINSRKYILRPEAIESVFIMYRITGDIYWREKGWKMFTAIQSYTLTELANSAISDVTSAVPVFADTMESFWLAETLKYFYLLYSDPSLVSLDEYIL